jgi:hypothetical protein
LHRGAASRATRGDRASDPMHTLFISFSIDRMIAIWMVRLLTGHLYSQSRYDEPGPTAAVRAVLVGPLE